MDWQETIGRVGLGILVIYGIGVVSKKLKLRSESKRAEAPFGFQEPEYPEMVVESLVMRPAVNEYLNTEFGSAPLPSTSNFVAMIRGTPI